MPGHKEQNRFRYVSPIYPKNQSNPAKKKKPNDSVGSLTDEDCDISVLSNILENAALNEDSIRKVTSVILGNPSIKNAIAMELIPEIEQMKSEIKVLHQQIDDLSQYSRKNCLKFSGIAENNTGSKEDTDKLILNLCNKIILKSSGVTLDALAIDNSHRLGPKPRSPHDPPRDVIVKFVRYRDRALVYGNKRNLKNYNNNPSSGYKVFVNEALTKHRAKMFSRLRKCKREGLIDSCWSYEGTLFVKKSRGGSKITIRTEEDVFSLENPNVCDRIDRQVLETSEV